MSEQNQAQTLTLAHSSMHQDAASVFSGVFGRRTPSGGIQVDDLFRRIYAFSIYPVIDVDRPIDLTVDGAIAPALKATLVKILGHMWDEAYARRSAMAGPMAGALAAEREIVQKHVSDIVRELGFSEGATVVPLVLTLETVEPLDDADGTFVPTAAATAVSGVAVAADQAAPPALLPSYVHGFAGQMVSSDIRIDVPIFGGDDERFAVARALMPAVWQIPEVRKQLGAVGVLRAERLGDDHVPLPEEGFGQG